MQKSAEAGDDSALVHEEVNQHEKPNDEELAKNLSILVGIGHESIFY